MFAGVAGAVGPSLSKAGAAVGSKFASAMGKTGSVLGPVVGKIAPFAVALGTVGGGFARASLGAARFGGSLAKIAAGSALSAVGRLGSLLPSIGSAFLNVGAAALKFAAVGGTIAAVLGVKAASAAAHLSETINTNKQVFGNASNAIVKDAERMNAAFGTSRKEYIEGANALGGQLQGVGYGSKDAAALSNQLLKLAADATASRDPLGGFAESLGKIRSGLSGEMEPLKAWGLDLSEAAVKAEALRMGIVKQASDLDNAGKVQARMSIITKGLAADQGALLRESTGPAAQMNEFWGRLSTLWETVGGSIAPALGVALEGVNTAIVAAGLAWESSRDAVTTWASSTLEGLGFANDGVGILQKTIGFLADAWGVVKGATAGVFSYMEAGLAKLSGWVAKLFEGLAALGAGDWASNLQTAFESYSGEAAKLSEDLGKTMQDAFNPTSLASTSVDDFFEKARKKIEGAKLELAKPATEAIGKPTPQGTPKEEKAKPTKLFGSAMLAGSSEAASTVLRSKYGAGKDGVAANTKRSAETLKTIAEYQKKTVDLLANRSMAVPEFIGL